MPLRHTWQLLGIIHHKTRHPLFMVGIPIIYVLQIIFTLVVLYAVGYIG